MNKFTKVGITLLSVAVLGAAPIVQNVGVFAEENTTKQSEQQVVYLTVYHSGYDAPGAWNTYHPLGVTQVPVHPGQTIYWNDIVSHFDGYTAGSGSVIIPYEAVADGSLAETSVPYYRNTPAPNPTPDPNPNPQPNPQPDPTPQPEQAITFTVTHNGYERAKPGIDGVGAFIETLLTEQVTVEPGGSINISRDFPGYDSLEGSITYEQAKNGDFATNGYVAMYLKKAETPTPDPQPQPNPTPQPDPKPDPQPKPNPNPGDDNKGGNQAQPGDNGKGGNSGKTDDGKAENPADQKPADKGDNKANQSAGEKPADNKASDKKSETVKPKSEGKKEATSAANTAAGDSSFLVAGSGLISAAVAAIFSFKKKEN
ncbi:MAG: hypothetical protein Q4A27_02950 [bacterium]|nr:hypothetical protein [bacterium]